MRQIPLVTRYLVLTNVVVFLIGLLCNQYGIDLNNMLGLHFVLASQFNPIQLVTYMFLHSGFAHIFFNMFSLWMLGGVIERTLGARRYLIYYLICGIGAGLCQELWQTAQYYIEGLSQYEMVTQGQGTLMPMNDYLNLWTTVGASGACYGILLAFGRLYPNEYIMLLIPPIPMKAKYFVAIFAVIELVSAWTSSGNIAHFAHLGGMIFGWFLLSWWKRRARRAQTFTGWNNWKGQRERRSWTSRMGERLGGLAGRRTATTAGNDHQQPARGDRFYEENMKAKADEARMDEILDKVRRSGYDSLTREEKNELFRISRR